MNDCIERAQRDVYPKGGLTFQKFTCIGCGSRQTMDTPNRWYKQGRCEKCGAITDLEERGCNYAAIFRVP